MKTIIATIFLLIVNLGNIYAQDNVDKKEMVGFACYFEGSPSKTVAKFARKLEKENYKWISKYLYSSNNAERYMSVITLEKLSELERYHLSKTEIKLISEIKNSTNLVSVCSGCTYFQQLELNLMFTSEMMTLSNSWLNYNLKIKN